MTARKKKPVKGNRNLPTVKAGAGAKGTPPAVKHVNMEALTARLKALTGSTATAAEDALRVSLQAIREAMAFTADDPVQTVKLRITHIGTFTVKPVPVHEARNPKTKETITVPANYRLSFKAASDWKDDLQSMMNNQLGIG